MILSQWMAARGGVASNRSRFVTPAFAAVLYCLATAAVAEACSIALGWHVDRCLQGLSELEIAGRVVRSPHGYCALP